jgi:anti-anti-sigma regulatory factor
MIPMMKITHGQGDNAVVRLCVEGWVTQQTVEELSSSCEVCLVDHRTLLLDLSGVRFVDTAGIDVLHDLVLCFTNNSRVG